MAVASADDVRVGAGRNPRAWDFVSLKLRLLRNGFRGRAWRIAAFVIGLGVGHLLGIRRQRAYGIHHGGRFTQFCWLKSNLDE